ncbi:hypothetical protein TNCV_2400811 [Trichonephila clavipes]|nr:hypothetical protein TNCV_2400811 [Trichonephila clavipes]
MPTFKITRQVGNPDFACVVRAELATLCFALYSVKTIFLSENVFEFESRFYHISHWRTSAFGAVIVGNSSGTRFVEGPSEDSPFLPESLQLRRRFVEWAQNDIAVVPDFHKRILFNDEAHSWLNGYVNKQNCRIWSEANPQVYVETPLHPEKLTVWCALWAGGILLQKR